MEVREAKSVRAMATQSGRLRTEWPTVRLRSHSVYKSLWVTRWTKGPISSS